MKKTRLESLLEFIRHIASAVTTASMYPLEHQQVQHLCALALESFQAAVNDQNDLSLQRIDDQLIFEGQPLGGGMYPVRFASMLKHRSVGLLRIAQQVEHQEIIQLIGSLSKGQEKEDLHSTKHIRYGKLELRYGDSKVERADSVTESKDSEIGNSDVTLPDYNNISDEQLSRLMEIFEASRKKKKLNTVGISEIVSSFIGAFVKEADPLLALAPLRDLDEYSFTHSINVCILNLAQAAALGIEGALLHDLGTAALLHDIGKTTIPEEVLNKKEPLTTEEWGMIRTHPFEGAKLLLGAPGVPRLAVVTAYEHHLRFDGKGYPSVNGCWEQNVSSYMTSISDVFDAMSTNRAYRQASDMEVVMTDLKNLGGRHLHPLLTENFVRIIGRHRPEFKDI
jgi:HD-GYP domain-containing protein (c-di-GMP phosphodiesterase class II)